MILSFFDRLFNKHKFVRRAVVVWAILAISWTMYVIIPSLETDGSKTTVLGIVIGLLASAIGFYKWSRTKEDEPNVRNDSETGG